MSRSGKRLLVWVALAVLVAVALVVGLSGKGASGGRPAPALPRELLAGPPATLATLRATADGHPSLVVFWASWCEPCQHEAPAVERFARSPAGRGRVVGVDWSDEAQSAAASFASTAGASRTCATTKARSDMPMGCGICRRRT